MSGTDQERETRRLAYSHQLLGGIVARKAQARMMSAQAFKLAHQAKELAHLSKRELEQLEEFGGPYLTKEEILKAKSAVYDTHETLKSLVGLVDW